MAVPGRHARPLAPVPTRRLYVTPPEFASASLTLNDERAHRLLTVLRLPVGAEIRVFDGVGHERVATLVEAARDRATLALGAPAEAVVEASVPVVLCCAFPRGARGDWLVEKATELGAHAFVALESARGVMRAGDGRVERWRRIAVEAAEQSGRAVVPTFQEGPPQGALSLVADLNVRQSPAEAIALASLPTAIALHVGPEGGWTDRERAAHEALGYASVGLGPRTLRVETGALALLTLTVAALGDRR